MTFFLMLTTELKIGLQWRERSRPGLPLQCNWKNSNIGKTRLPKLSHLKNYYLEDLGSLGL